MPGEKVVENERYTAAVVCNVFAVYDRVKDELLCFECFGPANRLKLLEDLYYGRDIRQSEIYKKYCIAINDQEQAARILYSRIPPEDSP